MKRFLKWTGIIVGSLILLIVLIIGLFLGWLRWSGERDWKRAEAELRAKGEKLTFAELVPPMPPDSENFFSDPLWAEYEDLVQRKNEHGVDELEPRLRTKKRQLDQQLYAPLSPMGKEQLFKLLPEQKRMPSHLRMTTKREALSLLRNKLLEEKDPQKQKVLASFYLEFIAPAAPLLNRIENLSQRPQAQFPLHYEYAEVLPLPQIGAIGLLSRTIECKALSELILGKKRDAAIDTQTLLRLTSIQKRELFMISFLVRSMSVKEALQPINEGILLHAWSESELRSFQDQLLRMNLREDLLASIRGERACHNQNFPLSTLLWEWNDFPQTYETPTFLQKVKEKIQALYLTCGVLKNRAYQNIWLQKNLDSLNSTITKGWNTSSASSLDQEVTVLAKNPIQRVIFLLNKSNSLGCSDSIQKTAECQTQVDQTLIACALERYRLAHGAYPTSLDAVVPQYLAKLPNSPITGKPMNYSLKPDGTFLLWSPGWNLKSLGGKPGEFKGDGDIVWGQPVSMKTKESSNPVAKGK
jgi:hypothetical protein